MRYTAWFALVVAGSLVLGSASTVHAGGQFAVSDRGIAAYSYPIAVPPGIAGMAPKLSLSYSGIGINGPVGLGWSVQGLSAITRCPATIATDGFNRGVSFGPADKLCLDGQRLIQTDANDIPLGTQTDDARGLATGSREYRTEKDIYARIRAYGIANGADTNGPAYFKVWTKSGQIYEYGAGPSADPNTQALINAQGKSVAAVWAVARISDTLGNYIDFKYEQRDVTWGSGPTAAGAPGHEWNISEIQYTGSAGQLPSNKIVFSYEDRVGDRAEAYHQGSKNVSVRLLQAVRTYVNSSNPTALGPAAIAVKVKTTKLVYVSGPITQRSLVSSITECAGSAESPCLPATTFTYASGGNDSYVVNANFSNSPLSSTLTMLGTATNYTLGTTETYGVLTGDFNGDGKTDIIRWSDNPAANQLYLSNGDGSFTLNSSFNITDQNLFKPDGCYLSTVADFNGDGISDILRYSNPQTASVANCTSYGPVYLYLGKGDGTFNRVPVTTPSLFLRQSALYHNTLCYSPEGCEPGDWNGWSSGSTYYLLDVDGDGILDIVTTILPGQAPVQSGNPPPSSNACLTQVCTRVFKGNGDGTFAEIPTNLANKSLYSNPNGGYVVGQPSNTVDVDVDGLTDIVGLPNYYFESAVGWRSRGDGNFDPLAAAPLCGYPIDFNGDLRNDCLTPGGTAASNALTYSDGTGTMPTVAGFNLKDPGQEFSAWNSTTSTYSAGIVVADFNGDGRQDILRWKDDPASNALYLSNGDGTFTQAPSSIFNLPASDNNLKNSDGLTDFTLGDFTGRGTVEILRLRNNKFNSNSNRLLVKADTTPPDQLISVTSSTGLTTRLTYVPLTNSGGRYTSDHAPNTVVTRIYPKLDLTPPSYVVTISTTDSGVGTGTISTDYSYFGLKADLLGRGLLGFKEIHRQAPGPNGDNLSVMTKYLQDYPYIGVASQTNTRRGTVNDTSAQLLSSSTFVYCDQTTAAGAEASATITAPCTTNSLVRRPYLYKSIETGSDLNGAALPTVTTTNVFNGSGDPRSIAVTTTGTIAGSANQTINQTFVKTTTNTYLPDNTAGDNWIRGRLQKATVQNAVPNSLGVISTSAGTAANATATAGTSPALQPVTISPTTVTQSQANAGPISGTATVSVGGYPTPPINYSWTRVPPSSTTLVSASPASGTSNGVTLSANLSLGQTANETFQVTVTDAAGRTGTATVPVYFSVTTNPLSITVPPSVSANRPNPGAINTTATVTTSGGQPPFTYNWTRVSGSRIAVTNTTTATATFSATLGWSENLQESFQVTVTDSIGQLRAANLTVTFTSPPALTVSISPNPLAISSSTSGGTASGSVTATGAGGVPPYSYNWVQTGGSGVTATNTATATASFSSVVTYGSSASATYQVTLTDTASNTVVSPLTVNASGPAWPPSSITLSPTSYSFGTVPDSTTRTATFTVTNSGGPGALSTTFTSNNLGPYISARTCPAEGSAMAAFTSCTIDVSFTGTAQCGGGVIQRSATFVVTVAGSTATASLTGANQVYSLTSPQCR